MLQLKHTLTNNFTAEWNELCDVTNTAKQGCNAPLAMQAQLTAKTLQRWRSELKAAENWIGFKNLVSPNQWNMINESGGVHCFLVSKARRTWGEMYWSSSAIKAAANSAQLNYTFSCSCLFLLCVIRASHFPHYRLDIIEAKPTAS